MPATPASVRRLLLAKTERARQLLCDTHSLAVSHGDVPFAVELCYLQARLGLAIDSYRGLEKPTDLKQSTAATTTTTAPTPTPTQTKSPVSSQSASPRLSPRSGRGRRSRRAPDMAKKSQPAPGGHTQQHRPQLQSASSRPTVAPASPAAFFAAAAARGVVVSSTALAVNSLPVRPENRTEVQNSLAIIPNSRPKRGLVDFANGMRAVRLATALQPIMEATSTGCIPTPPPSHRSDESASPTYTMTPFQLNPETVPADLANNAAAIDRDQASSGSGRTSFSGIESQCQSVNEIAASASSVTSTQSKSCGVLIDLGNETELIRTDECLIKGLTAGFYAKSGDEPPSSNDHANQVTPKNCVGVDAGVAA